MARDHWPLFVNNPLYLGVFQKGKTGIIEQHHWVPQQLRQSTRQSVACPVVQATSASHTWYHWGSWSSGLLEGGLNEWGGLLGRTTPSPLKRLRVDTRNRINFWNRSRGWKLGALTNSLHSWLAGAQGQTAQAGLVWLMYLCVYVICKELVRHNELWDR